MQIYVEVVAGSAGVLADQAFFVCFLDSALEDSGFMVKFAADIDICCGGVHGAADNETAFDELVRVLTHDFTVLACSRLTFVGVDDKVAGFLIILPAFEVHEGLTMLGLAVSGSCAWDLRI